MSETRPYIDDPVVDDPEGAPPGEEPQVGDSLASRVGARRQELEQSTDEVFEVPGWNDILGVRLRLLGFQESRRIAKNLAQVKPEELRDLYIVCESIVLATVELVEIQEDGSHKPSHHNWVSLAQALARQGAVNTDPGMQMTPRRALLAIIGDQRLPLLYAPWMAWSGGDTRKTVDETVVRDFDGTVSQPSQGTPSS